MKNNKKNILIAVSVFFLYGITLLLIKYPALYTSGSPNALFWSGVPEFSIWKSLFFLLFALIVSYFLSSLRCEFNEFPHAMFLFVVAFATSMLLWDMPEVNNDYAVYFNLAKTIEINGLNNIYQLGSTYLVMPVLDGYLFRLFGEERIIIQILRTVLFSLTAVVTYYIGKELWDRRVGFIAGALLMFFPYFLTKSHLLLLDVPLAFFVALSVFTIIKAHGNWKWYVVLLAVALLTLFTKKTGVIYLGFLLPAILLVLPSKYKWKIFKIAVPVLAVAGLITAITFSEFLKGVVQTLLYGQSVAYTSHSIYWINPQYYLKSLPIVAGPIVTILAFGSIVLFLKRRDYRLLIPVTWMVIPAFLMVYPALRHLIPAYPAYALAAAMVLVELEKGISIGKKSLTFSEQNWKFMFFSTLLLSFSMALFVLPQIETTHEDTNVKEAGEHIDQLDIKEITVFQISDGNLTWTSDSKNFANMLDYYTEGKVTFYRGVSQLKDQNSEPDAIAIVTDGIRSDLPEDLNKSLEGYYLSKMFSKGDYGFFSPTVFSVYLPQIEYHSRYPEFMQKMGKGMKTEVYEVANPNAGLLNFVTWTPPDRKILGKNVSVTWTIEAEEPLEVGFYYRKPDGFFADKGGREKIPEDSMTEITRVIEPSQTMGTYIRAVPIEADGRKMKIINVTFRSEYYNISVSRDLREFKF